MEKKYFCGHEISAHGLENGYVDYGTFSKCFQHVLCNNIPSIDETFYDNMVNYDDDYPEIFQYYIVSDNAKELLDMAHEVYTYSDTLDCYVWCVTHFGTGWDYVLTDIAIDW